MAGEVTNDLLDHCVQCLMLQVVRHDHLLSWQGHFDRLGGMESCAACQEKYLSQVPGSKKLSV